MIIAKQASGVLKPGAKGQRRADQDMLDALTALRESGQIPWEWIVDETRSLDDFTGYSSIADGVDAYLNVIRLDRWNGSAPLILTESRSLAGVLRALVREYGARIAPTNGQAAGFLHNEVAPLLSSGTGVLYLGDYDLAGGDIEDNTRRVLERYHALNWERLALTAEQVSDYGLTPIIKTDRRFKSGGAHEAVETEALSQRLIVEIVRLRERLGGYYRRPVSPAERDLERPRRVRSPLHEPRRALTARREGRGPNGAMFATLANFRSRRTFRVRRASCKLEGLLLYWRGLDGPASNQATPSPLIAASLRAALAEIFVDAERLKRRGGFNPPRGAAARAWLTCSLRQSPGLAQLLHDLAWPDLRAARQCGSDRLQKLGAAPVGDRTGQPQQDIHLFVGQMQRRHGASPRAPNAFRN